MFYGLFQEHGLTSQDIDVPDNSLKAISKGAFWNKLEKGSSNLFLRRIPLEKCSSHKEFPF